MSVVRLHQPEPCEDIVATLRVIADQIESGEHDVAKWPATTAVLIFGHETQRPDGGEIVMRRTRWSTHGFGPRNDVFTLRGRIATVLGKGFDSGDE